MKRAVVLVLTNDQGQVLLLERTKDDKHFPSEYCLPGGKVDWIKEKIEFTTEHINSVVDYIPRQETDDEACIRECIEETGIIPSLIQDTGITAVGSDAKFIVKIFKGLRAVDASEVTKEFPNREHNSFGFYDLEHLPKLIGSLTHKIVKQVLNIK